jgi:hypothetical protein
MGMVLIYVFSEPRAWKKKSGKTIVFNFSLRDELETRMNEEINKEGVYHVTAFNTYGDMVAELFKSQYIKGKAK